MINKIKNLLHNSSDLNIRFVDEDICILFFETVASNLTISDVLIKNIIYHYDKIDNNIEKIIPNAVLKEIPFNEIGFYLSAGYSIILFKDKILGIETRSDLDRSIGESSSETIVRGPKDSFTENLIKNIGLIRKRIKNSDLTVQTLTMGCLTNTRVSIVYMDNLVNKDKLDMLMKKIEEMKIDSIVDSGYIRKKLSGQFCTFPKILSTERPDLATINILKGRICIIVENSPFVLILPFSFFEFFNNPEDKYELLANSIFTKIIRFLAFIITLYTPAMYIAVTTFNKDIIPLQMLISLSSQVRMLPFSIFFEIFLLVTIFEILKEADIRVPSKLGSSLSIVGGLILGDAAVSAGIVSPIAVIIVAITSISSVLFSDIDFINGLRTWRYIFLFSSFFFGIYGILAFTFILYLHLSTKFTLKTNYLWGLK